MPTKHPDFHRRMMALADGGHVRGPGSGTSDSIPARLSDGEFVLPADTVRKVGVKSLRDLVNVTHQPSGRPTHPARFADGGVVNLTDRYKRSRTGFDADGWAQQQMQEQSQRTQEALAAGAAAESAAQAASAPDKPSAPLGAMHSAGSRSGAQMLASGLDSGARSFFDSFQKKPEASASPNPTDTRLSAGTQTTPMSDQLNQPKPQPEAPGETATTTAREVVPGVFNHGRGQYSDDPNGMNMPEGFTGRPSAQNDAILQRMSDQSQAQSMARIGMSQYDAEVQRAKNINADEAARNNSVGARMQRLADPFTAEGRAMRNLQMNIDSSVDRKGRPTAETAALVAQSKAMSDGYLAEPNQQRTVAAGLQREGMQQAGETQRLGMRTAIDQQRLNLEGDEFGLKREAVGFQNRTAQRIENAQVALENAKTPEQQRSARDRLLALAGKAPQNEWGLQVTPTTKNLDGSTTQGSVWRYNKMTGETALVDGKSSAVADVPSSKDALVKGQVYQTARGPARWDGGQFQPMR